MKLPLSFSFVNHEFGYPNHFGVKREFSVKDFAICRPKTHGDKASHKQVSFYISGKGLPAVKMVLLGGFVGGKGALALSFYNIFLTN